MVQPTEPSIPRTDLALEAGERYKQDNVEISGVIIEKHTDRRYPVTTTQVKITTENGARAMGKPKGTYITLETPDLNTAESACKKKVTLMLSQTLQKLLPDSPRGPAVLVAGLGNRMVTADALGPRVADQLMITRHILREYGAQAMEKEDPPVISSIVPGVMAQTGMDTLEIIKGIIDETQPDFVIAIDALAAMSTKRLMRTIQLADTGIHPGSGVGNHRNELSKDTLGIPVIAIGVPTVVEAATIVQDSGRLEQIPPHLNGMYVTPKDIDQSVEELSRIISDSLNMAFA